MWIFLGLCTFNLANIQYKSEYILAEGKQWLNWSVTVTHLSSLKSFSSPTESGWEGHIFIIP